MRGLIKFLSLTVLLALPFSSAFAASAYVHDLSGTLTSQQGSEPARALRMGDTFDAGVTLATAANSIAVLKFEDGQVVTLAPNTRFAVREYRYNVNSVKDSSIVFQLVQGGLRFVTGVIGSTNRNAFRMNVGTATIGVRGTDGWASYIEGVILAAVNQGALEFNTRAGTQTIPVFSTAVVDTQGATDTVRVAPSNQFAATLGAQGGIRGAVMNMVRSEQAVQSRINNVQIPINTPVVVAAAAQAAQVVATARVAQGLAAAAANNLAAAKTPDEIKAAQAAVAAANEAAGKATALATAAIATAQAAAVQAFTAATKGGGVPSTPPPPTPAATPLTAVVPSLTTAQINAQATLIQSTVVTQTTSLQTTQRTLGLPVTNTATIQSAPPLPPATPPPGTAPPATIPVVIPTPVPTPVSGSGASTS